MTTETTNNVDSRLVGWQVSFNFPDSVSYATFRDAFIKSGWDVSIAREMLPRDAWSRATRSMKKNRDIDRVKEEEKTIAFQFTTKFLDEGAAEMQFSKECVLTLDKETGTVTGDNDELASLAEKSIREHIGKRDSGDMLRAVKKCVEEHKKDLIITSKAGGAYFIPDTQPQLLSQIDTFLAAVGGNYYWKARVFLGDPNSSEGKAISENILRHLTTLVAQWKEKSAPLGPDARPFMIQRRQEALAEIKEKMQGYRDLLGILAEEAETAVNDAETQLMAQLVATVTDDEPAEDEPMIVPAAVSRTPEELEALAEMVGDDEPETVPAAEPTLDESIPGLEPDSEKLSALASLVADDDEDEIPAIFQGAM